MANKSLLWQGPQGLTGLVLKLYALGSDTLANTGGDMLTEATNAKGNYTATVTEALAGKYTWHVVDGSSNLVDDGTVWLTDVVGTYECFHGASAESSGGLVQVDVDALLDAADTVETGKTLRNLAKLVGSILGGDVSRSGFVITFEALGNDGTTRVIATIDGVGNREVTTLNL